MRLLLDESLPRRLARELLGHEVDNVRAQGWGGVENGTLLQYAAEAGFDALITSDRGLEFEQNLDTLPLTVVIVLAPSNSIHDLVPLMPDVLAAISENEGETTLLRVGA